ncbi:hypothetical protein SDC9_211135 [bioreactor metagenome]|uniref:Uncharacterized protein n=1 Tax=bioreactor metagenome TaxID=1076179 RepID=A0A645JJ55_9ZZZZ
MHGRNNVELGDTVMRQFTSDHGTRDHPDHLATRFENGIRHDTHQPHVSAAIDKAATGLCQLPAKRLCRGSISRAFPMA